MTIYRRTTGDQRYALLQFAPDRSTVAPDQGSCFGVCYAKHSTPLSAPGLAAELRPITFRWLTPALHGRARATPGGGSGVDVLIEDFGADRGIDTITHRRLGLPLLAGETELCGSEDDRCEPLPDRTLTWISVRHRLRPDDVLPKFQAIGQRDVED